MPALNRLIVALGVVAAASAAAAQPNRLGIGTPITEQQIQPWNIDVRPDGTGLPPGKGTVAQGEKIYSDNCAGCHGDNAQTPAKGFDRLSGGKGTLATGKPIQTIGSFWPYATTVYDYINRAMPFAAPQTLSHDEVYAVVAYLLYVNEIVPKDAVMDAKSLPKVKMPNADGFIPDARPDTEDLICKADCK